MSPVPRNHDDDVHEFVNPFVQLNAGLWSLFAGATFFLALRIWCKITRRHGLWYDDHILLVTWTVLFANNILIVYEFATGYVLEDSSDKWDDRMHILINISSCGTLIGQAWSKTAFGVTLLRMSNSWQRWILWFCIVTMNLYMVAKVVLQWAKICGKKSDEVYYRLDICLDKGFRNDFKEGGNVYNIVMDFIFASFPWLITRSLDMRRVEKIGLSLTMSLGMIVAIVAAVRVSWKDDGNARDPWYIYRNGMSQIWYSSEVAGTIIVQCIPILRPILREIQTSFTSKKLESSTDGGLSATFGSKRASGGTRASTIRASRAIHGKHGHGSSSNNNYNNNTSNLGVDRKAGAGAEGTALLGIPEIPSCRRGKNDFYWKEQPNSPYSSAPSTPADFELKPRPPTAPLPPIDFGLRPRPPTAPLPPVDFGPRPRPPTAPLPPVDFGLVPRPPTAPLPPTWPLTGNEGPDLTRHSNSTRSFDFDSDALSPLYPPSPYHPSPYDIETAPINGLSPPPPRRYP